MHWRSKELLVLVLFLGITSFAFASTVPRKTDPYLDPIKTEGRISYSLNIRIIDHGATIPANVVEEQIHAAEVIYSQCEGVNFHLNVVRQERGPWTDLQDNFTDVSDGKINLTSRFFSFFEPWVASRKPDVIDVHLVDFLNSEWRTYDPKTSNGETVFLGQAYNKNMFGWIFWDQRANQYPSVQEIAGDTLVLAMKTLELTTGKIRKILDRERSDVRRRRMFYKSIYQGFNYSLLAHELGHIVLESQKPGGNYMDHYCLDANDYCPPENLMSGGGFTDKVFLDSNNGKKIIGYSDLPQVEKAQCEALVRHSKIVHN